jgi:hypothetical protein
VRSPWPRRALPRARFEFTIPAIMRGPELYGREPQRVQWSADGRWIYFQWNPPGTDWREPSRLYRVRATGGSAPERVPDAQTDSVGPLLRPETSPVIGGLASSRRRATSTSCRVPVGLSDD